MRNKHTNKLLHLAAALLMATAAHAQQTGDGVLRIHTNDGATAAFMMAAVQDMEFAPVEPLRMDIGVESVSATEAVIDFPMPPGCSKWLMLVSPEPLAGTTERDRRQAMRERFQDEFADSKYFRLPGLQPQTTYHAYAMLYDADGVAAGLSEATFTTRPERASLTLGVQPSASDAAITITPSADFDSGKYYAFVVSEADHATMMARYGSLPEADRAFWEDMATMAGASVEDWVAALALSGDTTVMASALTGAPLAAQTDYVAYCYGVSADGTPTTEVVELAFSTPAPAESANRLSVSVTRAYADGCEVSVGTTNDDKYIVDVQSLDAWQRVLARHDGDERAAAAAIIATAYGSGVGGYLRQGDFSGRLSYGQPDTECVVIACGYDGGVTTPVATATFTTLAAE